MKTMMVGISSHNQPYSIQYSIKLVGITPSCVMAGATTQADPVFLKLYSMQGKLSDVPAVSCCGSGWFNGLWPGLAQHSSMKSIQPWFKMTQ